MKHLIDRVWEYSKNNSQGFTLNIETFKPIKKGIAVAYLETQNSFGKDGLINALNQALNHDKILGGWLEVESKEHYFDCVRIFRKLIKLSSLE